MGLTGPQGPAGPAGPTGPQGTGVPTYSAVETSSLGSTSVGSTATISSTTLVVGSYTPLNGGQIYAGGSQAGTLSGSISLTNLTCSNCDGSDVFSLEIGYFANEYFLVIGSCTFQWGNNQCDAALSGSFLLLPANTPVFAVMELTNDTSTTITGGTLTPSGGTGSTLLLTYPTANTTVTSLTSPHFVTGSAQFLADTSVTVTLGSAAFSSAYYCTVNSASVTGNIFNVNTTSLSSFVITSNNSTSETVQFVCMGN